MASWVDNRLARFNDERDAIVSSVVSRVVKSREEQAYGSGDQGLEYVLNDVAYFEVKRHQQSKSKSAQKKAAKWRSFALRIGSMSNAEKQTELSKLALTYASDVAGNFNPKVFGVARDVLPPALSFLLSPVRSIRDGVEAMGRLSESIRVEGDLDKIKNCAARGTFVVAPTHSSNLDSILIGLALHSSHLPPVTYGAGKNLFGNPLIGFFMHNLGAYKVDRRLKFSLYKDVLKTYSEVLLERGYHSLFFPGGTRCRSNKIEARLKLGLLGTTLTAYENLVRQGKKERIYIVPMTLNYQIVMEAESLIQDYLSEDGQSRYILENDEYSKIGKIVEFLRKTLVHNGEVVIRLGQPMDPFGNRINDEGDSVDKNNRVIDPSMYVRDADGKVVKDAQRNSVYTKTLGQRLATQFKHDSVFLPTHLLARAIYHEATKRYQCDDIYKLLRLASSSDALSWRSVCTTMDTLRALVHEHNKWGYVDTSLENDSSEDIASRGMSLFRSYHAKTLAYRSGESVHVGAMELIYYYQNRMAHVPLAR